MPEDLDVKQRRSKEAPEPASVESLDAISDAVATSPQSCASILWALALYLDDVRGAVSKGFADAVGKMDGEYPSPNLERAILGVPEALERASNSLDFVAQMCDGSERESWEEWIGAHRRADANERELREYLARHGLEYPLRVSELLAVREAMEAEKAEAKQREGERRPKRAS